MVDFKGDGPRPALDNRCPGEILYGEGDSITVFLQVAPDAASCYTTNDGEEDG